MTSSIARRVGAAFLDRDGSIVRDVGYASHPAQIEMLPGAARAIRLLNRAGILAVVITNQSAVARGLCDEAMLQEIHDRLRSLLRAEGASLDAIYYCPHHPDVISPTGDKRYQITCTCRKPQTGMVDRAVSQFSIDLERSALFGDSWRDVELARRVGIPGYLIGGDASTAGGVRLASDLEEAVRSWLSVC